MIHTTLNAANKIDRNLTRQAKKISNSVTRNDQQEQ